VTWCRFGGSSHDRHHPAASARGRRCSRCLSGSVLRSATSSVPTPPARHTAIRNVESMLTPLATWVCGSVARRRTSTPTPLLAPSSSRPRS